MQKFILSIFLMVLLFAISLSYIRIDARCIVEPGEPCTLSSLPEFLDSSGNPLTDIYTGQEVNIQLEIIGRTNSERAYVYIVLIEDNEGFTEQLSWIKGVVRQNETVTASLSWRPENAQDYTVTILVWDDLENPTAFDPVRMIEASITPLVRIVEGSANPEQKEYYSPRVIKVVLGVNNTVVWLNEDSVGHSVVSDQREFNSGFMGPNQTWSYTFTRAGIYSYHSEPGPWLKGTVIVLGQTETLTPDEEREMMERRDAQAIEIALNHPEVKKYSEGAFSVNWDVHPDYIDGRDVDMVFVGMTGQQTVEGHWRTGYTISYADVISITLTIDSASGEILETVIAKSESNTSNLTFDDDIQQILRFAMQDDWARKFLESDDYYVRGVRYPGNGLGTCYEEPCGIIVIDRIGSKISTVIEVNVFEGYPIHISISGYTLAPFQIRIVSDDPEPIPTFNIKAGESLEIPLRIVGQPSAKDDTTTVKLNAVMANLQDYGRYVSENRESTLENKAQFSFSTTVIEIRKTSDIPVNLNVTMPSDIEKGNYVIGISGHYEARSSGTLVYVNVE